ncbi:YdcF family protein [Gorillibacterium sp. CAU 1737]|uniref:YdcF family protein n=1 Tax=Gorillibacterium sp. CAU 1737 TaxID=3140362 RepID=UPI0032602063
MTNMKKASTPSELAQHPFACITELIFVSTELSPADLILVPGGSHPQQMKRAAELYRQGFASYVLPSGGFNPKLGETEWSYFRRIGVQGGIPEEAILREDQAANTFDNARYSWALIQEKKLKAERVILICKNQHARRALLTYQTVFPRTTEFQVCGVPDSRGIHRNSWYQDEAKIQAVMREVEKIGAYFGPHIPKWV